MERSYLRPAVSDELGQARTPRGGAELITLGVLPQSTSFRFVPQLNPTQWLNSCLRQPGIHLPLKSSVHTVLYPPITGYALLLRAATRTLEQWFTLSPAEQDARKSGVGTRPSRYAGECAGTRPSRNAGERVGTRPSRNAEGCAGTRPSRYAEALKESAGTRPSRNADDSRGDPSVTER